jgi:hypothetical protein
MLFIEFAGRQRLDHLARLRFDQGDEGDHPAVNESGEYRDDNEETNKTRQESPLTWEAESRPARLTA